MHTRRSRSIRVQSTGSIAEWWMRISSLLVVMCISLMLKGMPLDRTLKFVALASRRRARRRVSPLSLSATVDWALSHRRPLLRRNCLRRALSLFYLLRRQGIPVELHLGVRKQMIGLGGEQAAPWHLNGHAWLTLEGRAFLEPDQVAVDTYVETFRFGGDRDPLPAIR